MSYETETLDKLYLEWSQFTSAKTGKELALEAALAALKVQRYGTAPEDLARRFHEVYERLAPSFGYKTRTKTRQFDPTTPNGRLMIAVCGELMVPQRRCGTCADRYVP